MRIGEEWVQLSGGNFYLRNRGPSAIMYTTKAPESLGDGVVLAVGERVSVSGTSLWVRAQHRNAIIAYDSKPGVDEDIITTARDLALTDGRVFEAAGSDAAVSTGDVFDVIMKTGAGASVINEIKIQAQTSSFEFTLFRSPTYTGGTKINSMNLNDNSDNVPLADLYNGVTVTDTGETMYGPVNTFGADSGGNVGTYCSNSYYFPVILRPDTDYLIRVGNFSGNDGAMTIEIEWMAE